MLAKGCELREVAEKRPAVAAAERELAAVVVEPGGADLYRGRATFRGTTFGHFVMRRRHMADELQAQLVKHIDEAYAMEQNVLRMLDGMISTTDDPEVKGALQQHKLETQGH